MNGLTKEKKERLIPGLYETLYFVMNAGMIRTEPLPERMLWIQYEEGAEEQWYAPYFSMWILGNISQIEGSGNEYEYIYYEMNEIIMDYTEVPAEYFLLEGREGYCQHFASAAVLMYRLYGVPARYAAGYAVSPSSFVRQPDGFYLAEVTDESADAWPEIFVEDYGWIPIEVTPSADSPVPDYPNMDSGRLADLLSSDSWNLESLRQSGTETGIGTAHENTDRDFGFSITESIPAGSLPECMAYILLIAAAVFVLYRLLRLLAADMMEVRERFGRAIEAVHFAGYLKEYDGSEHDFAMRLSREVPEVTHRQIEWFWFPIRKKLIFKYIKTYL